MKIPNNSSCISELSVLGSTRRTRPLLDQASRESSKSRMNGWRGVRRGLLLLPLVFAGICRATSAPSALIVMDSTPIIEPNVVANLTSALQAAGYVVPTPVTTLPGSLSSYRQIWDVRYSTTLSASDISAYVGYLAGGGSLFVIGENPDDQPLRDTSIVSLIQSAGGGTVSVVDASNVETVLPPFTTTPDAVTSITFTDAGGSASAGTGTYITKDSNADGIGTAIVWRPGSLSSAAAGTLIAVFDVNFMESIADANSQALLANLIGPPFIISLNPASGPVGTTVIISGVSFGAAQGSSTVTFNGTVAGTVLSWSTTSITVKVPAGATTGNVLVTEGGVASNGVTFTVPLISVPTLSEIALTLLACGLLAIAAWRLRRRQQPAAI